MEEPANERTPILSKDNNQPTKPNTKLEDISTQPENFLDSVANQIDQRNYACNRSLLHISLDMCLKTKYSDLTYELILRFNKILVLYANSIEYDQDIENDIYVCNRIIMIIETKYPVQTAKYRSRINSPHHHKYAYFNPDRFAAMENYQGVKKTDPSIKTILHYKFIGKKVKQTMAKYEIKIAREKARKKRSAIIYVFCCGCFHLFYVTSYIYLVLDSKAQYSTNLKIASALLLISGFRSLIKNLTDPRLVNFYTANKIYRSPVNIPSWVNMVLYNIVRFVIASFTILAIVNDPGHYDAFKLILFIKCLLFIDALHLLAAIITIIAFLFVWCACCCVQAKCTKQINKRIKTFIAQQFMLSGSLDEVPNTFHETTCAICLGDFDQNANNIPSDNITKLACNHMFHSECIKSAMNYSFTCPTCKQKMV